MDRETHASEVEVDDGVFEKVDNASPPVIRVMQERNELPEPEGTRAVVLAKDWSRRRRALTLKYMVSFDGEESVEISGRTRKGQQPRMEVEIRECWFSFSFFFFSLFFYCSLLY